MLFQHIFSKVIESVTVEDNDETILQTKNVIFHTRFQTRPLGPGATPFMKGVGMLVGNFELNP